MGPRNLLVEGGNRAAGGRSQGKEQEEQENDVSSNLQLCEF